MLATAVILRLTSSSLRFCMNRPGSALLDNLLEAPGAIESDIEA